MKTPTDTTFRARRDCPFFLVIAAQAVQKRSIERPPGGPEGARSEQSRAVAPARAGATAALFRLPPRMPGQARHADSQTVIARPFVIAPTPSSRRMPGSRAAGPPRPEAPPRPPRLPPWIPGQARYDEPVSRTWGTREPDMTTSAIIPRVVSMTLTRHEKIMACRSLNHRGHSRRRILIQTGISGPSIIPGLWPIA